MRTMKKVDVFLNVFKVEKVFSVRLQSNEILFDFNLFRVVSASRIVCIVCTILISVYRQIDRFLFVGRFLFVDRSLPLLHDSFLFLDRFLFVNWLLFLDRFLFLRRFLFVDWFVLLHCTVKHLSVHKKIQKMKRKFVLIGTSAVLLLQMGT